VDGFEQANEHATSLSEHTFDFKGVRKIGTKSAHFRHKFQTSDDHADATGPAPNPIRDRQQRLACLRGITTVGSWHAKAGKQARAGNHPAQLRSWIEEASVVADPNQPPATPTKAKR
jgi:hypothetical protein